MTQEVEFELRLNPAVAEFRLREVLEAGRYLLAKPVSDWRELVATREEIHRWQTKAQAVLDDALVSPGPGRDFASLVQANGEAETRDGSASQLDEAVLQTRERLNRLVRYVLHVQRHSRQWPDEPSPGKRGRLPSARGKRAVLVAGFLLAITMLSFLARETATNVVNHAVEDVWSTACISFHDVEIGDGCADLPKSP